MERRVGGDSELTEIGLQFAYHQANFFMHEFRDLKDSQCKILTSTMKRAITTSEVISKFLGTKYMSLKTLDELDYGLCDGMLLSEIAEKHSDKIKEREKNKLTFRFPRGESYVDVINRIEPIIFEIERIRTPLIIVAHETILRCLYAYLH
jgi:broad specificity phosphatase PhoE